MNGLEFITTLGLVCACFVAIFVLLLMAVYHFRFHYACRFGYKCFNNEMDWVENRLLHLLQTILMVTMCYAGLYFWKFEGWNLWLSLGFGFVGPFIVALVWEVLIALLVWMIGPQHEYLKK